MRGGEEVYKRHRRDPPRARCADGRRAPRVKRVGGPVLQGAARRVAVPDDDRQYCIDLGLIARRDRQLQIANRIYREVLPRELTSIVPVSYTHLTLPTRDLV